MRGTDRQQAAMYSYISPEARVPQDHPLRALRSMVDAVPVEMSPRFATMYAPIGRPSVAPEKLLRALLLQVLYSVRSERLLMEELPLLGTPSVGASWAIGCIILPQMGHVRYADPAKEESRYALFGTAAQILFEERVSPRDASSLILVDGRQSHSRDVDALEAHGFRRQNINALAKKWDAFVARTYYGGVNIVEDELANHLLTTQNQYQVACLDFCKPLGNEPDEQHFTVFSHLFEHQRLGSPSVLITNFNFVAYWNNPMYRELLRAYAAPDYYRDGGFGMTSRRAWSRGWRSAAEGVIPTLCYRRCFPRCFPSSGARRDEKRSTASPFGGAGPDGDGLQELGEQTVKRCLNRCQATSQFLAGFSC